MSAIVICTQIFTIIISCIAGINGLAKRIIISFNILWIVLLIIATVAPYGGYTISVDTYFLFWLFLIFFNFFFVFTRGQKTSKPMAYNELDILNQYDRLILSNRTIRIGLYIVTVILLVYAIRYSSLMTIDTFLNARNERFFVGGLFKSTIEILFYNYLVSMWRFLFTFIIAFSILYGRMKSIQFILSVLDLVLYSYIGSSRLPVVLLIVNMLVLWLIKSYYNRKGVTIKSFKTALIITSVLFLGIFVMTYITAFRRGMLRFDFESVLDNLSILYEQVIGYNIGPLSGFSYLLDNGIMYNHFFWGRAVLLNGIEEIWTFVLSFVGIGAESAKFTLAQISNVNRYVGTEQFNALYTSVYWFFSDLGVIGVVLFSGMFGWLEKKLLSIFNHRPNLFSMMMIVHVLFFMFLSHMVWQINNVDSLLYMLAIYIFYKKAKRKGEIV